MEWNVEEVVFLHPPDVYTGSFDNAKMQARHERQMQDKFEQIKNAIQRETDPLKAMKILHVRDHLQFFVTIWCSFARPAGLRKRCLSCMAGSTVLSLQAVMPGCGTSCLPSAILDGCMPSANLSVLLPPLSTGDRSRVSREVSVGRLTGKERRGSRNAGRTLQWVAANCARWISSRPMSWCTSGIGMKMRSSSSRRSSTWRRSVLSVGAECDLRSSWGVAKGARSGIQAVCVEKINSLRAPSGLRL